MLIRRLRSGNTKPPKSVTQTKFQQEHKTVQLLTQNTGVQVFQTVVGALMFSFGMCRMVGEYFDVSDERTCVHLQGDMVVPVDAAVQCYTDVSSADSLEKRR